MSVIRRATTSEAPKLSTTTSSATPIPTSKPDTKLIEAAANDDDDDANTKPKDVPPATSSVPPKYSAPAPSPSSVAPYSSVTKSTSTAPLSKPTIPTDISNKAEKDPSPPPPPAMSTSTAPSAKSDAPENANPKDAPKDAPKDSQVASSGPAPTLSPAPTSAGVPSETVPATTAAPESTLANLPPTSTTSLSDAVFESIISGSSSMPAIPTDLPNKQETATASPTGTLASASASASSTSTAYPTLAAQTGAPPSNMKVVIPVAASVGGLMVLGGVSLAVSMRYRRGLWPFNKKEVTFGEMGDPDLEKREVERRAVDKWDPASRNDSRISRFIRRNDTMNM